MFQVHFHSDPDCGRENMRESLEYLSGRILCIFLKEKTPLRRGPNPQLKRDYWKISFFLFSMEFCHFLSERIRCALRSTFLALAQVLMFTVGLRVKNALEIKYFQYSFYWNKRNDIDELREQNGHPLWNEGIYWLLSDEGSSLLKTNKSKFDAAVLVLRAELKRKTNFFDCFCWFMSGETTWLAFAIRLEHFFHIQKGISWPLELLKCNNPKKLIFFICDNARHFHSILAFAFIKVVRMFFVMML
jgi:hypothetical protein